MAQVIFAIDDGQGPLHRNAFMQDMMRNKIKFRQQIGSFALDDGQASIVEWSYSVDERDFGKIPSVYMYHQSMVLIVSDTNSAHLVALERGRLTKLSVGMGRYREVTEGRAATLLNWTFDIPTQTYWAAYRERTAPNSPPALGVLVELASHVH